MSQAHVSYDWRVLSHDSVTGRTVYIKQDGPRVTVRTEMPVDDLLDENVALQAARAGERWGDGQHVARVPAHIHQRELMPAIMDGDDAYVKRWLNDPDHSKFRTRSGKL